MPNPQSDALITITPSPSADEKPHSTVLFDDLLKAAKPLTGEQCYQNAVKANSQGQYGMAAQWLYIAWIQKTHALAIKIFKGEKSLAAQDSQFAASALDDPWQQALCSWGGIGQQRDVNKAFQLFKTLAENERFLPAKGILGWMYRRGEGTAQDLKKAFEWFEAAAKQGNASAAWNGALCYSEKSSSWFGLAARLYREKGLAKDVIDCFNRLLDLSKTHEVASLCLILLQTTDEKWAAADQVAHFLPDQKALSDEDKA